LSQLAKYLPASFGTYIEPFVGGGALFFHLRPGRAVLIDTNPELANVYRVIKDDVNGLILSLKKHVNDSTYYYDVRNADRDPCAFKGWSDVERASRTIFMNRVCFNGLYRVNKKGEFNVPFGGKPARCQPSLTKGHDRPRVVRAMPRFRDEGGSRLHGSAVRPAVDHGLVHELHPRLFR
jgi:DNA adenine methylase Dam